MIISQIKVESGFMAESFLDRKAVPVVPVEKAPELSSRVIKRGPSELHSPLDTLSVASESRTLGRYSEGTHHSVSKAAHATKVAANVQEHLNEGTASLHERFIKMLQSL